MNNSLISKTAASLLLVGALTACGGGGGDPAPAVVAAPTSFTVTGTAATGAAFAGATVTLIDSTGKPFAANAVTGADGSYTITVPLTAKAPFVIQAVSADNSVTLISVVAAADPAKPTTANITPVTNLIASRLSVSGDPTLLAGELKAGTASFDATKLKIAVDEIVKLIQPLMTAVGDSTDPLNGNIQAAVTAGTGADKMLDSLSINITPSSATSGATPATTGVNIEISVKQKLADGVNPPVITLGGGANTKTTAGALSTTLALSDLLPDNTATLIADYVQRMTACYALAQSVRVNSTAATATDIIAPACKDLFLGNDPTSYLSSGAIVSKTGAWSSIFGTVTGVTFDRGSYEFTRANGDLVMAYRATDTSGNVTYNTLALRADTDKKLRAIGNQYKYNGGVNAYHQLRNFINQPAATYYSTGYNLNVNDSIDATTGLSIFAKVVVTAPDGTTQYILQPAGGSSYLPLFKGGKTTGTNIVRIRSVYTDPTNSAKDPALSDTTLVFAATPLTDDQIAGLAAQSTWKFEYYLASAPTVIAATEYFKTRARAMTIAELQTQPLAALTQADIDYVKTNTLTVTSGTSAGAKYLPTPATGPVGLDWVVPTGALAPTSIQVYGSAAAVAPSTTRPGFNDKTGVASTARTGNIVCSTASINDKHCSAGNYVSSDTLNGVHLWAEDAAGRDFASFYAFYTMTIN